MSVYVYSVYRTPRIDTWIDEKPTSLYPFKFTCLARDLDPSIFADKETYKRAARLNGVFKRIHRKWEDPKTGCVVGPEYVYMADAPAEGVLVYRNDDRIIKWIDYNELPMTFVGTLRKNSSQNWVVDPITCHVDATVDEI